MYFVPWSWIVKDPHPQAWLEGPMLFFNLWRLPLLFFISGAGTWFNLRRRGAAAFARERTVRLLVPLVFGMLVVTPPQTYVERLLSGQRYDSYLAFWATVFTLRPYPRGNLAWIHLWFLPYVLLYALAGLPLWLWLRGPRGRAAVDGLARLCARWRGAVYLLNLPVVAAALVLGPRFPRTYDLFNDRAYLATSSLTFLGGYVLCGSPRFLDLLQDRWRAHARVAGALALLVYAVRLAPLPAPALTRPCAQAVVDAYFAMAMILALVGWSRARLNRDGPALRWASRAVYPFYIVHQTVTVVLGYAWRGWEAPFAAKFPLLLLGTALGTWAVFELARRTRPTRVLLGMRA